ncbi:MAG: N-acetylmuramoyl-L-alanine amidase, partial [Hyphomicrobium sp.]
SSSERLVARVRSAPRKKHDLRVVLDLKDRVRPKSFLLKPNSTYGHRLVIDLFPSADSQSEPRVVKVSPVERGELRDVTVVIDPGHGGEDPGATGYSGIREKHLTFAIAKKLADLLNQQRGMRAVMMRTGDYYVGLRKRMKIARENRADLFVSIHADAFRDSRVYGSSVYVLSRNGASSEAARWLAEQENAADLVGGVSLDDKDDLLASVLLDLSQTATLSASMNAGADVLVELKKLGKTHKNSVQQAGFMVLKSPDIPSILVETAYISNPDEERKLTNVGHQQALAAAIVTGVRNYFEHHAPPGTLLALRKHVISKGDTLSELAARYQVPLSSLRSTNRLTGDGLKVGQVLRIPNSQGS